MPQRQWRSDDTDQWVYGFGTGSDGDLTISSNTTDSPIDSSCSGTSGATSLTATNASFATGQFILIHQSRGTGAGNWELNRIASYTAGTITTSHALTNTYTDSGNSQAQVLVMKQYKDVSVNSTYTLTGKSWDGNVGGILAFFSNGTTTITGTISVKGTNGSGPSTSVGTTTGGGFFGGQTTTTPTNGFCGEGTAGPSASSQSKNGNGGGGGSNSAAGGGGGNGTAGNAGSGLGTPGEGGDSAGVAQLTTMVFGGGGGGGDGAGSWQKASGGSSGGLVLIFGKDITITGSIGTNGGNGGDGGTTGDGRASGGGGAGGSILFKSQNATLGSLLVVSAGGGGGTSNVRPGGAGGVGRIHIDYSGSFTGTTSPTIDSRVDSTIVPFISNKNYFYFM